MATNPKLSNGVAFLVGVGSAVIIWNFADLAYWVILTINQQ